MTGTRQADRFRRVMARFTTGVAVVSAVDEGGEPLGFTANAVASVSLDPVLVLVAVDRNSASLPTLLASGAFALSFLKADHADLARRFSSEGRDARFRGLELGVERTGAPVLRDALAWVDCTLWKVVEAGDHLVVFGEVEACDVQDEGAPLLFYEGRYRTLTG